MAHMRDEGSFEGDSSVVNPSPASPSGSNPGISSDNILPDDSALVDTQPQTHPQYDWDSLAAVPEENLIGCLIPATEDCEHFGLSNSRLSRVWYIGRDPANDLVVFGEKLSDFHCTLHWNGEMGSKCEVRLTDTSSDGTWIDNIKLTKGQSALVRSGNSISLGEIPNARFIYRDIQGQSMQKGHQIWEKYDIGHELGSGAFARVHKCVSRASKIEYALKIIKRRKFHSQEKQRTLEREILILKNLTQVSHRHIASFVEHFEEKDTIYLVLELVEGDNLLKYLANRGALPEQEARRMAAQICDAVAYIHSQGITHRDLKLENIMLTLSAPPDCKLVDFGLAKSSGSGTFLKTICGTPAYLAPELKMDGSLRYDNLVDSWSLGIIFHCMLTNYTPFSGSLTAVRAATPDSGIGAETIDWSLLQAKDISQDGHDFLRQLLTPNPSCRKAVTSMLEHPWISEFFMPRSGISDTIRPSHPLEYSNVQSETMRQGKKTAKRQNWSRDEMNGRTQTERALRRSARIAALTTHSVKRKGKQ